MLMMHEYRLFETTGQNKRNKKKAETMIYDVNERAVQKLPDPEEEHCDVEGVAVNTFSLNEVKRFLAYSKETNVMADAGTVRARFVAKPE